MSVSDSIIIAVFDMVLALGILFFPCFCFWKIAGKINARGRWMAWVPGLYLFLICRIVKISYWWASVCLITLFIPSFLGKPANFFSPAGFLGILTFLLILSKLPQALGVRSMQRYLIVIPGVNYVYLGYLAFRKETASISAPVDKGPCAVEMFSEASLLEHKGQLTEAIAKYRTIEANYPDTEFSKDARISIEAIKNRL